MGRSVDVRPSDAKSQKYLCDEHGEGQAHWNSSLESRELNMQNTGCQSDLYGLGDPWWNLMYVPNAPDNSIEHPDYRCVYYSRETDCGCYTGALDIHLHCEYLTHGCRTGLTTPVSQLGRLLPVS